MRYCTLLAMFSRQSVCVFSAGLFLQGVFSSEHALPEVPLQPTFAIASSYPAQAAMKPRAVLERNVSQKLKFVYL